MKHCFVALEVAVQRVHELRHGIRSVLKDQLFDGAQAVADVGRAGKGHGVGHVGIHSAPGDVGGLLNAALHHSRLERTGGIIGKHLFIHVFIEVHIGHEETELLLEGVVDLLEAGEGAGISGMGPHLPAQPGRIAVVERQVKDQRQVDHAAGQVQGPARHRGGIAAGDGAPAGDLKGPAVVQHLPDQHVVTDELHLSTEDLGRLHRLDQEILWGILAGEDHDVLG